MKDIEQHRQNIRCTANDQNLQKNQNVLEHFQTSPGVQTLCTVQANPAMTNRMTNDDSVEDEDRAHSHEKDNHNGYERREEGSRRESA